MTNFPLRRTGAEDFAVFPALLAVDFVAVLVVLDVLAAVFDAADFVPVADFLVVVVSDLTAPVLLAEVLAVVADFLAVLVLLVEADFLVAPVFEVDDFVDVFLAAGFFAAGAGFSIEACASLPPILNSLPPHTGQVPVVAGEPFSI
jgi:hypothetical protein